MKRCGGSFKGLIGECMLKLTRNDLVITKFFNKQKYLSVFDNYLSDKQKQFLLENWYSVDGIELQFDSGYKQIILFEIKTRNRYYPDKKFKPKMTLRTHEIYNKSREFGFMPVIATVWLEENWNFDIELTEFDEKYYCIDKPKPYDSARGQTSLFPRHNLE